jgi:predicted KAP-like P-loop ATPase
MAMRYSDQPITRPGEDALGRASFAFELARSIDNLSVAGEGFVMALVGEWGAGKTSVIELIVRYLRHIEMERASRHQLVGESQPSPQTIDQIELLAIEFDKIRSKIDAIHELNLDTTQWQRQFRWNQFRNWLDSDLATDAADRYWRLKLRVDSNPRTVVVRFSPWLIAGKAEMATALLSELARALGEPFGEDLKQAFGSLIARLAEFIPVAGAGIDLATGTKLSSFLSVGSVWSRNIAKSMTSGPTLDDLRNKLRGLLRRLNKQQVLVIVDDVDRLTPFEALEMVSLVKSVGDLPNVVYLLSYHDVKLAELIHKAINVSGYELLEKIVQYTIVLPPIEADDLWRLFNADLQRILGDLSPDTQRRLELEWYFTLRFYLEKPRDVRRFINAIAVAHSNLRDYTDAMDLILLIALQLFEPDVYWLLRRNLNDLTE